MVKYQISCKQTDITLSDKTKLYSLYVEREKVFLSSENLFQKLVTEENTNVSMVCSLVSGNYNLLFGSTFSGKESNNNLALGEGSLKDASVLGKCVALGDFSMGNCSATEYNIGIGSYSLHSVRGKYNIGIGIDVAKNLSDELSSGNIFLGNKSSADADGYLIDNLIGGSHSCENIRGINCNNVFLGTRIAQNLNSEIVSDSNVFIGTEIGINSSNISSCIAIGSKSCDTVTGKYVVSLGHECLTSTSGNASESIVIGYRAGSNHSYTDISKVILIGSEAGYSETAALKSSEDLIAVGTRSLYNSVSDNVYALGCFAGYSSALTNSLLFGKNSGRDSKGSNNIYVGTNSGFGREGSDNIVVGMVKPYADFELNCCTIIGNGIFHIKGNNAVIIGNEAGLCSEGSLHGDVLIGRQAGAFQKFDYDNPNLFIGHSSGKAGVGSNSRGNILSIGSNCCRSDEQEFQNLVVIGHNSCCFSTKIVDSVVVGNSSNIDAKGENNIILGHNIGKSFCGNDNILIGNNFAEGLTINNRFSIFVNGKQFLQGDILKSNLYLSRTPNLDLDADLCFFLEDTKSEPENITKGSAVFSKNGILSTRSEEVTSLLSLPYRYYVPRNQSLFISIHSTKNKSHENVFFMYVKSSKADFKIVLPKAETNSSDYQLRTIEDNYVLSYETNCYVEIYPDNPSLDCLQVAVI